MQELIDFVEKYSAFIVAIGAFITGVELISTKIKRMEIRMKKALIEEPMAEIKSIQAETSAEIKALQTETSAEIKSVQSDVSYLMMDRLAQGHDYYCYTQGWATSAEKERMCMIYRHYKESGRNHLADSYEQDIMELPEHPAERNVS